MSSDNPPYPYYPNIPYNPSFFTSDSGTGFTEAQANTLYLKKTVPDTATAQETFNAGITTPTITSTGAMQIGPSSGALTIGPPNNATMNIGNNSSVDLNVGIGSRSSFPATIHKYSNGDNIPAGNDVYLNNGSKNKSSTNIQNGAGTTLTDCNGSVNILTGAYNTGAVNLGQFTTLTPIANYSTTNIKGKSMISTTGGDCTIGSYSFGDSKTTINGLVDIGRINTATINIGSGGIIDVQGVIGLNSASDTHDITIGNNNGGITNLKSNTIGIGTAGTTTTMNGTVNATGLVGYAKPNVDNNFSVVQTCSGVKTSTLSSATGTTLSISSESLMARAVDIATNATGGAIQIGSGATTTTLFGTVNASGLTGYAKTGANTNTFSSLQTLSGGLTLTGTTLINNSGTSNTTIGGGTITFNKPLTIGYTIQPTSTQLGYQVDGTLLAGATQGATPVLVSTITLPVTGVWNIIFVLQFIALGQTQMVASLSIPAPESVTYNYNVPLQLGSSFYFQTNGSYTGYFTGSTVSLILDGGNGTAFSGYYGKFRAVRVA